MTDWQIQSRSHSCSHTQQPFSEGQFFYTLLYRETDGSLRREDLCEEAFSARPESPVPFSFWRSKYEAPPPPPPEPLQKNDAESLLRALVASGDGRYQNVVYILALMLERKRILRPVDQTDPDTLVYEHPTTGETFVLLNPHLTFEQIPAVQKEVAEMLDASLSTATPPAPQPAPEVVS